MAILGQLVDSIAFSDNVIEVVPVSDTLTISAIEELGSTASNLLDTLAFSVIREVQLSHLISDSFGFSDSVSPAAQYLGIVLNTISYKDFINAVLSGDRLELISLLSNEELKFAIVVNLLDSLNYIESLSSRLAVIFNESFLLDSKEDIAALRELLETLLPTDLLEINKLILGLLLDNLSIVSTETGFLNLIISIIDSLNLTEIYETVITFLSSIDDVIELKDSLPIKEFFTISFNPKIFSATEYTGFNFNTIEEIDSEHYLFSDTGIYKIDQSPVDVKMSIPFTDFGTSNLKNLYRLYLDGFISDNISIFVDIDKKYQFQFTKPNSINEISFGKGIKGKYAKVTIEGTQLNEFTLDKLELLLNLFRRKR